MSRRYEGYGLRRGSSRDPGNTRSFLRSEGWVLLDESGSRTRWKGYYQNGDVYMKGGLIETASGRQKYYVKEPTRQFYRRAHSGRCQLKEANLVEDAYLIHWNRRPQAWADGIRRIEAMMV